MTVVGAAAAAEKGQVGEGAAQVAALAAEFSGVARVELGAVIELGMTEAGGVGAQAADALEPGTAVIPSPAQMPWMGAIDHVGGGRPRRDAVHGFDGLAQAVPGGQAAVRLDREGDDGGNGERRGGIGDAHGLLNVVQGEGADAVRARVPQHADLRGVVARGLAGGHECRGQVAVAARAEIAANDHGCGRTLELLAQLVHEADGVAVDGGQAPGVKAELLSPVRAGAPGGAFQHKAHAVAARHLRIGAVVAAERGAPGGVLEQDKGGELRQRDAFVEDESGFHAAVGEEDGAGELREGFGLHVGWMVSTPHGVSRGLTL